MKVRREADNSRVIISSLKKGDAFTLSGDIIWMLINISPDTDNDIRAVDLEDGCVGRFSPNTPVVPQDGEFVCK